MRIAIVSPYSWEHPGGVNNHVEGLSARLLARGHDVTVVAPDAPGAGDGQGPVFADAGRSVPVPANGSIAHLALLPGTGARVRRALDGARPEVVHVHEPLVPLVSSSAVRASRVRVVATFHAAGEGGSFLYSLASRMRRSLISRVDTRIAVSAAARDLASRYFPGTYEIVPNGVDTSRFKPGLPRPASFPEGPVVLFVGRDEPRKGLPVMLKAFPAIRESVPDCGLLLAGAGIESEAVMRRLPPGLREAVRVVGYVSNDQLPAYYSAADVFCAPALGGESFGVVLLEAMASGTAVVASNIPGYAGVIERTGGGVLFEPGDSLGLAGAVVGLLEDPGATRALSEAGLSGVREFSWERLAVRLEELYRGGAS